MKLKFFLISIFTLIECYIFAQNALYNSIHQSDYNFYKNINIQNSQQLDSIRGKFVPNGRQQNKACNLNKIVFGWHPYWSNGLEGNYDWSLLSDLSYFCYEVDPNTGNAVTTNSWSTANVVTQALANGVRVNLCVTLFSSHATFFGSSTSQQTLITNLINLVQSRGANGVNIDFEAVPASQKTAFNNFLVNLCNQMHSAIPNSQVSIALYAVDWSTVFDIPVINNYIDLFIIMGYDYYYGGSATAGPTSGLYSLTSSYNYNVSKSINSYLNAGVSPSKLVLGLPYYGLNWTTTSNTVPSSTTATGTSRTYKTVRNNTSGFYISTNKYFNFDSYTPYYVYNNSGWNQTWVDDAYSLGKKFELVYKRNIAGIGIWALGYDDGYPDLWNKISQKLTTCRTDACTDTIYDMGGPSWNYYDKEDYYYTIAPAGASAVSLNFSSFALETGYDSLWVYDGNSTNSPLIGGYSGTALPSVITSTGPSLTIRFHSDISTTASGFTAIWQCLNDIIAPTTSINSTTNWKTSDFNVSFTDVDNSNGSGVEKSFYSVFDFDGTYWKANSNNGFFNDDFDALLPEWSIYSGMWNVSAGALTQSDEANANSNIYASLNQTLSNRYIYHFKAKVSGSAANRRFGFHFFCDSANYLNRNNSYFVWFRVDDQSLQFYKVTNDTYSLVNTVSGITTTLNQVYDYKITYDRITGKISIWRDDLYLGGWLDNSPYGTNGNFISFRTGNCAMTIDEFNVYRSRYPSVNVTLGDNTKDIRYQNPAPTTPSAKISSIIVDNNNNISSIVTNTENIDWTPPETPLWVNDSLLNDIDTTYQNLQLWGNWATSNDVNSGLLNYYYSIGTSTSDSSITGTWVNNSLNNSFTQNSLSLVNNTTYYINVKAVNNAGLVSSVNSSNGIIVLSPNNIEILNNKVSVFPNPADNIIYFVGFSKKSEIKIYDLNSKLILSKIIKNNIEEINTAKIENGIYLIKYLNNNKIVSYKFSVQHK